MLLAEVKGPGNIYRRHGTGANGHGTLIFFNVAYPCGKHFFFTNEMPMEQILFLMHYFMAEFS